MLSPSKLIPGVGLPCDKGPSIFDIRHNFTANAVYELPFGPGRSYLNHEGAVGKIVGGWSLSSIGIWHTGHPLTVTMNLPGNDTFLLPDGNDQTNQRPDIIPGVALTLPDPRNNGLRLVNPAAFQAPPIERLHSKLHGTTLVDLCFLHEGKV